VDELILHMAPAEGVDVQQLTEQVRARFQSDIEMTPNRVEIHSLEDMLQRIRLESALKEVRILDARPKE
jgi:hypothetical protein